MRLRAATLLLGLGLLGLAGSALSAGASAVRPVVEPAKAGTQCVADPAFMRRNHMDLLKHQRDDTVRSGVRGGKHSLKDCIDCHASKQTAAVNKAPTDFCVSCHTYSAVTLDCFECHTGKPAAVAGQGAK
jgi:hypothetical protein